MKILRLASARDEKKFFYRGKIVVFSNILLIFAAII
jgi:hypothetical protein